MPGVQSPKYSTLRILRFGSKFSIWLRFAKGVDFWGDRVKSFTLFITVLPPSRPRFTPKQIIVCFFILKLLCRLGKRNSQS